MYELIRLSEHDYYMDCPCKVGFVRGEGNMVSLIDSGSDKEAAKKILSHIESNGWKLHSVYNTHSHADHIGGNRYLQEKTGCSVFANGIEKVHTEYPIIEPIELYGGNPPAEMMIKFFMASQSNVEYLTPQTIPSGWEIIPLGGHTLDMVGFRTPDNNVFLGDSVSGEEMLKKHAVSFLYDIGKSLETLEKIKSIKAEKYIPSHAPVESDIVRLADINIQAIENNERTILDILKTELNFDEIVKKVFDTYAIRMSIQQYCLIGCTIKSYLTHLLGQKRIEYIAKDNRIVFRAL